MKIYIICPVRNVTPEQKKEIDDYVANLEKEGHTVHYPPRDVNQNDETGWNILAQHRAIMKTCNRVDVFWDKTSMGSHFDLGMAFMMEQMPIKLVKKYQDDTPGKSFVKAMMMWSGEIMEEGGFSVGDIVSHKSGRICNGRYGEIIEFQGELMVQDNEGALDMPVSGNEDKLVIVGTVERNPELLKIFV